MKMGHYSSRIGSRCASCLAWLYYISGLIAARWQDTLKISDMQVSPMEIENTLLGHPHKLIVDASVAGVSSGRILGEKVPRAWVVLSETGAQKGEAAVVEALDTWV